eukprot:2907447-Prymnesium_polylepis.1
MGRLLTNASEGGRKEKLGERKRLWPAGRRGRRKERVARGEKFGTRRVSCGARSASDGRAVRRLKGA